MAPDLPPPPPGGEPGGERCGSRAQHSRLGSPRKRGEGPPLPAEAPRLRVPLVLVAAVAENGVIGRAGGLPWRLKTDLKRFRALTTGHPVVMGRRTYLSFGAPLKGRTNIVVSRDLGFSAAGVVVAPSLETALEAAEGDALRRAAAAIVIGGGADIYLKTISQAARLEITRVHARPDGDTVFPEIDPAQWRETARQDYAAGPDDEAPFTTLTYERQRE
jgi:dihydrofolate reductase